MSDGSKGKQPRFIHHVSEWCSKNPWMVVITVLGGLGMGLFGVYGYFHPLDSRPRLTYSVSPTRTAIVKSGQASSLQVTCKGKPVIGDVTGVQIAVWNAGKQPLDSEDKPVLEPVKIVTEPRVRILEVTVKRRSREVTKLEPDVSPSSAPRAAKRFCGEQPSTLYLGRV